MNKKSYKNEKRVAVSAIFNFFFFLERIATIQRDYIFNDYTLSHILKLVFLQTRIISIIITNSHYMSA